MISIEKFAIAALLLPAFMTATPAHAVNPKPKEVYTSNNRTCVLFDDGTAKCWGSNSTCALGEEMKNQYYGAEFGETPAKLKPINVGGREKIVSLSVAATHTCALLSDGHVKCWGYAGSGVIGPVSGNIGCEAKTMGDRLMPVDLGTKTSVKKVASGLNSNCVLFEDGRIKCWGSNPAGQLGLGDTKNRGERKEDLGNNLPYVDLGERVRAVDISAGGTHYCAVLNDATVKCWGQNSTGQLGLGDLVGRGGQAGSMGDALPRVNLGESFRVKKTVAGQFYTCALSEDGFIKCWGGNTVGQLGVGDTASRGATHDSMGDRLPVLRIFDRLPGAVASFGTVGPDSYSTCARLFNGTVRCWGYNGYGQLGIESALSSIGGQSPDEIESIPEINVGTRTWVKKISISISHACAITSYDQVKCWGTGYYGALGRGDGRNVVLGNRLGDMGDNLEAVKLFESDVR